MLAFDSSWQGDQGFFDVHLLLINSIMDIRLFNLFIVYLV